MQMIAAVITFCERERIIGCTKCLVEIDTAVALVVGADPVIDGTAQLLTERCVGAPAVNRQKGSEIDAVMKLSGFLDIPFQTIDQSAAVGRSLMGRNGLTSVPTGWMISLMPCWMMTVSAPAVGISWAKRLVPLRP